MGDKTRGLYGKFGKIERTDGQSAPGQKHEHCDYFILDKTHDKHAVAALEAYAASCQKDYPLLAVDLRHDLIRMRAAFGMKPKDDAVHIVELALGSRFGAAAKGKAEEIVRKLLE